MLADNHVMWDTPATLAGAARSCPGRLTIAESVVTLRSRYTEFFEICHRFDIEIIVALEHTFQRIPLKQYITERAIQWDIALPGTTTPTK